MLETQHDTMGGYHTDNYQHDHYRTQHYHALPSNKRPLPPYNHGIPDDVHPRVGHCLISAYSPADNNQVDRSGNEEEKKKMLRLFHYLNPFLMGKADDIGNEMRPPPFPKSNSDKNCHEIRNKKNTAITFVGLDDFSVHEFRSLPLSPN